MTPLLRMAGDERLARMVTAGHDHAFTALYDRYRDILVRYCRSLVRDDQDALDAFQSTMLNALRALREDRRRAPVRPWLFRIAHNESVSVLRRRPAAEPLDDRQVGMVDVHRTAEDREALAGLLEDLGSLTEHQRAALLLRELGGLAYDDVASVLETTPLAARQAVFAARASLHDQREGRELPCAMVQRRLSDADRRASRTRAVRAHLRRCHDCRGFASAIGRRRRAAVLLPVPPAFASTGILSSILDAGGASAVGGGGVVATGVIAKAAVALSAAVVATGAAERPRVVGGTRDGGGSTATASAATHTTRTAVATAGGAPATSSARAVAGSGVVRYASVAAPAAATTATETSDTAGGRPDAGADRATPRAQRGWGRHTAERDNPGRRVEARSGATPVALRPGPDDGGIRDDAATAFVPATRSEHASWRRDRMGAEPGSPSPSRSAPPADDTPASTSTPAPTATTQPEATTTTTTVAPPTTTTAEPATTAAAPAAADSPTPVVP